MTIFDTVVSMILIQVGTAIQPGGYLADFNKVSSITATHSPSGRTYPLIASTCKNWQLPNHWPWTIFLRPEVWMFSGTWSFTLVYVGSDKKEHIQICDGNLDNSGNKYPIVAAPIGAIPPPVSNIQIIGTSTGEFLVSWSGIGDNPGNVDYRIEMYDADDICVETVYRMTWRAASDGTCPTGQVCVGTYDPALNRVSFIIPGSYPYRLVRLRQEIMAPNKGWPRSLKQTRLPEW